VKDENLSVIEEFMPSGRCEVRHYHKKAQQFFFVLSGGVMMEVEVRATKSVIHLRAGFVSW
jgi:oxalate decarboxylase/phosphoglucose isomerase-like protein (cupin superfamily)